jgi:alkaline phosphatase D
VHANYVADLKADYDDPKSAVVASEFCGTSISSLGLAQDRVDAARRFNPHVHHARADKRGYVRFTLSPKDLRADLRELNDALEIDSGITTGSSWVVDAARPGARKA